MLKIAMLSTGDEVLYGDILDTNAAWLSRALLQQGFMMSKRSTIGDQLSALVEELVMLSLNHQLVIVNGGLGPTSDDLSTLAAAKATDQKLVLFPEWLAHIQSHFERRQQTMPESNIKQAILPEKAQIIPNERGTACGFKLYINHCCFYFTPGVPHEFKHMVESTILPEVIKQYPDITGTECSRFYTFGTSESALSDQLDKLQLPADYRLGYRSYAPFIEVKLIGPKRDLERRVKLMQLLHAHLADHVVSIDRPMLEQLGYLLQEQQLTLSIAEQSTQGYLSQWLLDDHNIAQASGHHWILSASASVELAAQEPLTAALALAGATKEKCATDLALVTGALIDDNVCVAISTPKGEWGARVQLLSSASEQDIKTLIATLAADVLRRYLSAKPLFVSSSRIRVLKELYLPAIVLK